MKNPKRSLIAAAIAIGVCAILKSVFNWKELGTFRYSCLYMLAFLNCNELLKE